MYCSYCNTWNENDDLFCKSCGHKLEKPKESATDDYDRKKHEILRCNEKKDSATSLNAREKEQSERAKQRVIRTVSLGFVVIALVATIIALRMQGEKEMAAAEEPPGVGDEFEYTDTYEGDNFTANSGDEDLEENAIQSSLDCYITTDIVNILIAPGESIDLLVSGSGTELPPNFYFSINWFDVDISTEWGEWVNETTSTIRITGDSSSSGNAYIYLVDSSTDERLASCEITIDIGTEYSAGNVDDVAGDENFNRQSSCYCLQSLYLQSDGWCAELAEANQISGGWDWGVGWAIYAVSEDAVFADALNNRQLSVDELFNEWSINGAIYIIEVVFDSNGVITEGDIVWCGYNDGY